MSALIRFDEVSLAFGDQAILRQASFQLEPRERVCLIGRNGAGTGLCGSGRLAAKRR